MKHFLFPMQEMRVQTQNGGPHLLVLYWRLGKYTYTWLKIIGLGD
jgi:hypothetical protein